MRVNFDKTKDGIDVHNFTIKNNQGMSVSIIEYGATVTAITVPDKDGKPVDVVLGYDTLAEYEENGFYFGCIVGRNANRIAKATYTIDGVSYDLLVNDNDNNLHSGPKGFDKVVWTGEEVDDATVKFTYSSPDMEDGFPGNMEAVVTYHITEENALRMTFEATTDKATIANFASHTYYNLDGHDKGSIEKHNVQLFASNITPAVDEQAIPTGELMDVTGTPFDFRTAKTIGQDIDADDQQIAFAGGYDHNFVMDGEPTELRPFGIFKSDKSGIIMKVSSNQQGMQFYTGNFITKHAGKGGTEYDFRYGFAIEPQFTPNAINDSHFASPVLRPGEKYLSETVLEFSAE